MQVNGEKVECEPCYYCGLPASDVEHVIPKAALRAYAGVDGLTEEMTRGRKLTVPACRECNSLLGATVQNTLAERKSYLKERLQAKYANLLAMPEWTEKELAEMGEAMRQSIKASMNQRVLTKERLRWNGGTVKRIPKHQRAKAPYGIKQEKKIPPKRNKPQKKSITTIPSELDAIPEWARTRFGVMDVLSQRLWEIWGKPDTVVAKRLCNGVLISAGPQQKDAI